MHEFALMTDIMRIALDECARHGAHRLKKIRVRYGTLNMIVPDAMRMAFEAFTSGTENEGAELELVEEPLHMNCRACGKATETNSREALFHPCPHCGKIAGFECDGGDGIFLDHLEAE